MHNMHISLSERIRTQSARTLFLTAAVYFAYFVHGEIRDSDLYMDLYVRTGHGEV